MPHRDLALQLYHWVERISAQLSKSPLTSISSLAHVLVRGAGTTAEDQVARLRADPPHMVIGTPQALLDVFERDAGALRPETLSTIVVDEVDYLIEGAPRKTSEWNARKLAWKARAHPNLTGLVLDKVFAAHALKPRYAGSHEDESEGERRWNQRSAKERRNTRPAPQLVLASATLRTRLKMELLAKDGWLTRGSEGMAQVTGKTVHKKSNQFAGSELGGKGIVHCVVVVSSDGQARNIAGAVDPPPVEQVHKMPDQVEEPDVPVGLDYPDEIPGRHIAYPLYLVIDSCSFFAVPRKQLPFSPTLLETGMYWLYFAMLLGCK